MVRTGRLHESGLCRVFLCQENQILHDSDKTACYKHGNRIALKSLTFHTISAIIAPESAPVFNREYWFYNLEIRNNVTALLLGG